MNLFAGVKRAIIMLKYRNVITEKHLWSGINVIWYATYDSHNTYGCLTVTTAAKGSIEDVCSTFLLSCHMEISPKTLDRLPLYFVQTFMVPWWFTLLRHNVSSLFLLSLFIIISCLGVQRLYGLTLIWQWCRYNGGLKWQGDLQTQNWVISFSF